MSRSDNIGTYEAYDLHQHTHCTVIYMGKTKIAVDTFSTSSRSSPNSKNELGKEASITYNKQRTDILSWGDQAFEKNSKDHIHVDNFSSGLYSVFKKGNDNRDEDDRLLMTVVSDYIRLAVKDSIEQCKFKIENDDALHYAFVTPSEWEEEINEDLIRPIFIQSGLISLDDDKDKLLFFTDIESICYGLKDKDFKKYPFYRGQNTILCRLVPIEMSTVSVKLDLISTMNPLFDFPESRLFPKIVRSTSLSISSKDIKDSIKLFLQTNLSISDQDPRMNMMVEYIYNKELPDMDPRVTRDMFISYDDDDHVEYDIYDDEDFFIYDDDEYDDEDYSDEEEDEYSDGFDRNNNDSSKEGNGVDEEEHEFWITENFAWKLTEIQKAIIRSVEPFDVYSNIIKALSDTTKNLISQNFMKEYSLLIIEDQYSSAYKRDYSLLKWIKYMLEHNRRSLNSIVTISQSDSSTEISRDKILFGAIEGVFEAIQNADMYCRPRVLSTENIHTSSSIFLKSRPHAIMNINISLKSTLLSFSTVNNNGLLESTFGHNHFNTNNRIPSLESFYNDSDKIATNQFASFAKNYLTDGSSLQKYFTVESSVMYMLKTELSKQKYGIHKIYEEVFLWEFQKCIGVERWMNFPNKGKFIPCMKNELTKTFLLIYIAYIKDVILNSFLGDSIYADEGAQIGFAVSVEKMLLDNIIGSKNDLQSLIYASGLLEDDSEFKKLRVTIQGDELLPVIQQSLNLKFPLKSYFVLSQLYEDYVRLTLNQIVTSPSSEEQEAVILQEKIIPIVNIYDSLCLNMWNNILENNSLIRLCGFHKEEKSIEIFSFQNKKYFTKCFKKYLSNTIFKDSPYWRRVNTTSIELGAFCSCRAHLTVNDIIDISIRPVLRCVASTVLTSLIDEQQFGKYMNIEYIFNFIYFNHSQTFQATLVRILDDIFDDFAQEQSIDVECLVMSELPNKNLQPVLGKQPLLYKGFLNGTLHQVFSSSYTFSFSQMSEHFMFKNKREDKNGILIDENTAFILMEKGDIISNLRLNKIIYLNLRKQLSGHFFIHYHNFKMRDELKGMDILSLKDYGVERIGNSCVDLQNIDVKAADDLKVMISIVSHYYSSSIRLSAKLVGTDTEKEYFMEIGEPMTLCRF